MRIPHYFHTEERQVKYPLVWNKYGHPIPIVFHTKLSLHEHKNLYSFHYSFHILHFTKLDTISVPYHGLARYGLLFTMSNPYFYFVRESIFYPSILVYVFFCDLYQLFLFGLCFTLVFYFWGGRECTQTRFNFSIACLCSQSYKKLVSPVQFRFQFSS